MPQQQLAPVSKDRHANKYWNKYKTFEFAAQEHLAPLVVAELPRAVKHFTMAFVQAGESYQLMAVLSPLTPGQNMYVHPDGRWIGEYVPSCFRGYPFRLAKPPGQDNLVLCVDEGSGLVSDTEGEPFFDD